MEAMTLDDATRRYETLGELLATRMGELCDRVCRLLDDGDDRDQVRAFFQVKQDEIRGEINDAINELQNTATKQPAGLGSVQSKPADDQK